MTKLNRSVERGMNVVETVVECGVCSLGLLADKTGLPKPTLLRICATLVEQRWLSQSSGDKRYRIGNRFPRLGAEMELVDAVVEAGKAEIVALSQTTGLAVDLAVSIGNGRVEIVDTTRAFSKHGIFPDSIGYRPSPFRSALGSVFLAAMDTKELAKLSANLIANTTGSDRIAALDLPKKIHKIKADGYAIREEGYWGRAVDYGGVPRAISIAICKGKQPVGALSLIWLAEKRSVQSVADDYLSDLSQSAAAIGRRLSGGSQ